MRKLSKIPQKKSKSKINKPSLDLINNGSKISKPLQGISQ